MHQFTALENLQAMAKGMPKPVLMKPQYLKANHFVRGLKGRLLPGPSG